MNKILKQIRKCLIWLTGKIDSHIALASQSHGNEKPDDKIQQCQNELTNLKIDVQELRTQYNLVQKQCDLLQKQYDLVQKQVDNMQYTPLSPVPTQQQETKREAPVIETYFIKRMDMDGNIEIRNKIPCDEAYFELATLDNKAELRPLPAQSDYLIMQREYLLELAFTVSGLGKSISVIAPAKYELQGDKWSVKEKGKVELI